MVVILSRNTERIAQSYSKQRLNLVSVLPVLIFSVQVNPGGEEPKTNSGRQLLQPITQAVGTPLRSARAGFNEGQVPSGGSAGCAPCEVVKQLIMGPIKDRRGEIGLEWS